jgi:hypothetical protein
VQFLACARPVCPAAVQKDCADQVGDVEKRTPTVVIHAKDKSGQDLVSVNVTSDGAVLTEQLDGRGIAVNPGVHTFRFEAAGNEPFEQKVVVGEGEHDRPITASFGGGGALGGGGGGEAPAAKKGVPVGGIILGVVGLIGMGVGSAFYVVGFNQKSTDESGCGATPQGCSSSEISDIRTKLAIGDVAFYTGVACLAGGIIWTIVHYTSGGGGKKEGAQAATFDVGPTALGHGAYASTTVHF